MPDSVVIQAYPARASVLPGEQLILHVSTDRERFRVCMYRWWHGAVAVQRSDWLKGVFAPARGAAQDWQWPQYAFPIPADWPSGVYLAHLEVDGGAPFAISLATAAALFVVRGRGRARLLYKIPLATFHAYNDCGGACYYQDPPRSSAPPGARVSLLRPGGGIGGTVWGAPDFYDGGSPRQSFAHWDAPFIRWLAAKGYEVDFCTDFDVHADPSLCSRYRLLLSVGHDEYWSEAGRNAVEDFIASGGNVAFFAANVCWWRVHFVDGGAAMVCHQGGPAGALDHWWAPRGAARPEDALSGVSYRHGGGWWDGPRETDGYIVQDPDHWVFAQTGLRQGERFGVGSAPPLVGYECDGAPLASFANGRAVLSDRARAQGTPARFHILAASPLDERWQERPPREGHGAGEGVHAATMALYRRKGTVFTAGTTDWAQVLASGQDPCVEQITRNVIDGLLEK